MWTTEDGPLRRAQPYLERGADPTLLREALEAVIRNHKPRVYRVCLRVTSDPSQATELTRHTVSRAYREVADVGDKSIWSWLCALTWRVALDAVRFTGEPLVHDGVLLPQDPTLDNLRALSSRERSEVIDRAAAGLDRLAREVVHLRYIERLPTRVIERILALTGVRESLERIRPKLAYTLEGALTV